VDNGKSGGCFVFGQLTLFRVARAPHNPKGSEESLIACCGFEPETGRRRDEKMKVVAVGRSGDGDGDDGGGGGGGGGCGGGILPGPMEKRVCRRC
jgi:hypothetical protein